MIGSLPVAESILSKLKSTACITWLLFSDHYRAKKENDQIDMVENIFWGRAIGSHRLRSRET